MRKITICILVSGVLILILYNYSIEVRLLSRYLYQNEGYFNAIHLGDTVKIAQYLDRGIDVNYQDKYGMSGLHIAVLDGRINVVKFFLTRDADPCLKDKLLLQNPYEMALANKRFEEAKVIKKTSSCLLPENTK